VIRNGVRKLLKLQGSIGLVREIGMVLLQDASLINIAMRFIGTTTRGENAHFSFDVSVSNRRDLMRRYEGSMREV